MRMMSNVTSGEYVVLEGFSAQPQLEKILFAVSLLFYLLSLVGKTAVILVTRLSYLSLVDLCITTSIVPQLLWNLRGPSKAITMVGCAVRLYISLALESTECILLAVMALDHHAAVCRPLHYTTVRHSRLHRAAVGLAPLSGVQNTTIQATVIFFLLRCGHWRLPHVLCEMSTMLKLAYVDVRANEIRLIVGTLVLILLPLSLISVSYGSIARAMLRIKSTRFWRKSLGTCGSHLLVVTPFYGSIKYRNFHLSSELTKPPENKEDISAVQETMKTTKQKKGKRMVVAKLRFSRLG
ncbi:olfactory receptor 2G3-like [Tachyglossus aculeatus]|uniref:olfactory receptor 2G3-like n=1 Tax=Tachyglossus aculeatus TaxID=9261 RepID=UPI0018F75CF8|nr:olfactory receptor 2G3-like [Tachyglossus aculeatus]